MSFIPGTWSISKCCPNSKIMSTWLRNSHCVEKRSHQRLISAVGPFPAMWRLFYIESVPGCIFSTQARSADISSKTNCCGMTCWKRNQNVSRHLAACQFPGLEQIYMAIHGRKFIKQPVLYFVTWLRYGATINSSWNDVKWHVNSRFSNIKSGKNT